MVKVIDNRVIWAAPFYFDDSKAQAIEKHLSSKNSIWRNAEIKIEGDIFYNHIQQELQASANSKLRTEYLEHSKKCQYRFYSLKQSQSLSEENAPQELRERIQAWEYFKGKNMEFPKTKSTFCIEIADPSMKTSVPSNPCETLYIPHILLWKEANVGMLIFSTKLGEKGVVDIKDLMNFNYAFHKTNKQATKFSVIPRNIKEDICNGKATKIPCTKDVMQYMMNVKGCTPEASVVAEAAGINFTKKDTAEEREEKKKQINNIIKQINQKREDKYNEQTAKTAQRRAKRKSFYAFREASTVDEIEPLACDSTMIVEFLLDGLYRYEADDENNIITLSNKNSLKLFTYYQILNDSYSSESVDNCCMEQDFLRIGKCMNDKYQVCMDNEKGSNTILKTFSNIYVCAYAEGVAMLTVNTRNEEDYEEISDKGIVLKKGKARNFFDDFCNDNYEKRYLWIELWIELQRQAQLYGIKLIADRYNQDDEAEAIGKLVDKIQKMKADTYFSDISNHTQHNEFYLFCRNNLNIDERFEEIDKKLLPLYSSLARKKKKDEDAEQRRKDEKNNQNIVTLTILIALMTFPSAVSDGMAFVVDRFNLLTAWLWVFLCLVFYIGIVIFGYYKFSNKTKKKIELNNNN